MHIIMGEHGLAVKTLNTNYDLDIQDYVTINFLGLETIINKLGGVTIDVASGDVAEVNKFIQELNEVNGGEWVGKLSGSGTQTLNGRQAVAYARIRMVGNGDARRTERQREVLQQVISKLMNLGYSNLISVVYDFMPYVETSFSITDVLQISTSYSKFKNAQVYQYRYPDVYVGATIGGASVVKPKTLESNVIDMFKFIYEVDEYIVTDTVKEISKAIENKR